MSAITGIYNFNHISVETEQGFGLMKALQKYPANDIQIWQKENLFLGCHAQWITPESINEPLPYYDSERRLAITADAIIDNREELFERLSFRHADQKGMPDSQLILHAYQKWGEECPKYLVGDFAFMIWDERNGKLFGARDFSGSRTLYYFMNHEQFVFSSIINPLFTLDYIRRDINEEWMTEFLAIPEMVDAVNTGSTVYKHIEQIPPAHSITVIEGKVTLYRYCRLVADEHLKLNSNLEYEEAFQEVFRGAVNARLRTFRQVGAQLSGGLDSGTVVSFAAKALWKENKRLHTFSYIPESNFVDWTPKYRMADERQYIKSTVGHVGNITDHYLSFEGKSPFSEVDDWLDTLEMPYKFFENSFWIKGIYEKAHQLGIGMLLNGQRGNLTISFGNVEDYYAILLKKMRWIHLYKHLNMYSKNIGVKKSRILSVVRHRAFPANRSSDHLEQDLMLINPEFAKRTSVFRKLDDSGIIMPGTPFPNSFEARKQQFEKLYLWNINGTIGTRFSLKYSLWERDPTNDLNVIRFCLSLPPEQFVQNGLDRSLIRRATKRYLPDEVRLNHRIRGIQGADGIHRMTSSWQTFMKEIQQMCKDSWVSEHLNLPAIQKASLNMTEPRSQDVYNTDFKILMRSLIVYRFIKKMA